MLEDVTGPTNTLIKPAHLDYSLTGENAAKAVEMGLAEADWYQSPVPRATLRKLLERKDGPAIRDTILWFGLIGGFAWATFLLWGSWWAILPYLAYAALYAGSSDSRWHEAGHGTAFRTDWMNNALYEIASFMVMRESVVWRWSHTRHHSDTIIVGRDPEIAVPRPPDIKALILAIFNLTVYPQYFKRIFLHSLGRMEDDEQTYIPETEYPKIYRNARIYLMVYGFVIVTAILTQSFLPLFYVGLTNLFGSWLMVLYGLTQHAGLAENVLDHRLNCRTVYMNPIHRFLYWNMNYHVEHHMFPLVPYHRQMELHDAIKDDCPEPYPNLLVAYREIIPAILRQVKEPAWHVKRKLPETNKEQEQDAYTSQDKPDDKGWVDVCESSALHNEDVLRFDHDRRTYALYRDGDGQLHATDGFCTHGNTHLADGLVKGKIIECPKHNGRFNLEDGAPVRVPVCRALATYPIEEKHGRIRFNLNKREAGDIQEEKTFTFKVLSNDNVSTFIKELILEPDSPEDLVEFQPGDYMQLDIPEYNSIRFREFDIPEPYAQVWERQHVFDLVASHSGAGRRNNYSLASNPQKEKLLRFNVRIATPPPGQDCPPGAGSSYVFNLKAGDRVTAIGPFGDFHIKPTQREMVYIGGGAGMAPLRAHLSHLFENEQTNRRVSFWYGARSRQELYYLDYFEALDQQHSNFSFHPALSDPLQEDDWDGDTGFIHEVALVNYLRDHPNPKSVEYYLCGPPMMIRACRKMLDQLDVAPFQIAFDEF